MKNLQPKFQIGDKVYHFVQFTGTPFSCVVRSTIERYIVESDRILYDLKLDKKWKPFLKRVDPKLRERVGDDWHLMEDNLKTTPQKAVLYGLSYYEEIVHNIKQLNFKEV